ncbi:hypothetical protein [Roseococcus sp.]
MAAAIAAEVEFEICTRFQKSFLTDVAAEAPHMWGNLNLLQAEV